jgi:hypothetical protein
MAKKNEQFTLPLNFSSSLMSLVWIFLKAFAQAVGDVDHHNLYVTSNINLTAKPQSPPHVGTAHG